MYHLLVGVLVVLFVIVSRREVKLPWFSRSTCFCLFLCLSVCLWIIYFLGFNNRWMVAQKSEGGSSSLCCLWASREKLAKNVFIFCSVLSSSCTFLFSLSLSLSLSLSIYLSIYLYLTLSLSLSLPFLRIVVNRGLMGNWRRFASQLRIARTEWPGD